MKTFDGRVKILRLHDEKPSVAERSVSLYIDLIIWHPRDRGEKALVASLQEHRLGERSQTVVWLDKFTVRLMMWHGQYLSDLSEEDWRAASEDLVGFLQDVHAHYQPHSITYDTRAYSVGLHRRTAKRRMPVTAVANAWPGKGQPVWWELTFS